MKFEAVIYNLHVLGKAVKNLPDELCKRHGHVPWRKIAGMRDTPDDPLPEEMRRAFAGEEDEDP